MIKKIRVEDLEPGMHISDFNTPWLRHPFFPTRITLRRARDIERMLMCGMQEVYIDTARGKDSPKAIAAEEADEELKRRMRKEVLDDALEQEFVSRPRVPFEVEFRQARQIYAEATVTVQDQFEEVGQGNRVDAESTQLTVTEMIESIFRNRDALLCLARIKSFDEYTLQHSLNVTVLALNLAIHLGILHRELLRLGIGAVLHDLGKVRLPGGLIQKEGPFDVSEYEIVKTHAAHGASILLEARSIPLECAAVPLGHHERFDGTGYPRRLSGIGVGKFGLITAIADVYDAMTTDRPYQKGMSPTQVLKRLYEWAGSHFHPIYVRKFIQCVGIYPIGAVVELDTGEVGVVTCQNRGELLRPWVRLVRTAAGQPLAHPVDVDLRDPDPNGDKLFARTVERVVHARWAGVDVGAILSQSTAGSGDPEPSSAVG